MTTSTRIVLASRPHGAPTAENFRTETAELRPPGEGEVLLETLDLSLDPYMRGMMDDADSYTAPIEIGQTMVGGTVSRVLESRDPSYEPGVLVLGYAGWQTHSVEPAKRLTPIRDTGLPASTALGVLGMPGFTAWAGLENIGKPQPGETVVVAAATGPVGSMVGQIARLRGARAVGIAGGTEKVAHLHELGFDAAINHRADDFEDQLAAATPDGIDVYFENVGGKVWDAVLPRLNTYARVPVCGLVANYNSTSLPDGPDRSQALLGRILKRSLTVRGFIQNEFAATQTDAFLTEIAPLVADGSIRYREDVTDGLDNAVAAFAGMLEGRNFGKAVVHIAD
ncbi:NADP-dependent oxidoreductase [Propionibacteriaceae bacterium Y1700]|uniref:NADP-dependent oxidoreductase n=1 Tax=Microlunatus sp. Y1700 TaxID=3418487 RepID=UPI003DA740C7